MLFLSGKNMFTLTNIFCIMVNYNFSPNNKVAIVLTNIFCIMVNIVEYYFIMEEDMKINKISNKFLCTVLSLMFVFASFGISGNKVMSNSYAETEVKNGYLENGVQKDLITSEYELRDTITGANTNTGKELSFDLVDGKAIVELDNYKVNSKKSGYLLIDVKKDFVKGYNSKYFSNKTGDDYIDDAMKISTNFSSEPTVIEKGFCSYSSDRNDFVRFYVPYKNVNGKMIVSFSIPNSVQEKINESIKKSKIKFDKYLESALKNENIDRQEIEYKKLDMINENRMRAILYSEDIDVDNLIENEKSNLIYNGNSPVSGFVKVDAYSKNEKEMVYKGFVFDKDNKILRIKPNTSGNKVRLYLGAGNNNGFSFVPQNNSRVEFDIRYYSDGSIYRKVNDGKVHESNEFSKSEYDRKFMRLSSGFNSIDIPMNTTDGIVEIKLNGANNFLLNLKLQNLDDYNVSQPSEEKPSVSEGEENNKIEAESTRISGSNRYNTAIELSKKAFDESKIAIVASGENFADALSGGALAAANNAPLLLIDNNSTTINDVNRELRRLGVEKVYVLGGKNAISINTEMKLTSDADNNDKRRIVNRLSGNDRYETSYEIYKEVTRTSGTKEEPILVNGNQFADALSAGALSASTKRGIILTDGHNVNSKINKKDSNNIVIGGHASMDSTFGGKRISGSNRYETSVNVAKYFNNPKNIMLASGEKYPDGLASITLYHKYEGPLLLTPADKLPNETKNYIKNNDVKDVYIIGGNNSVSNSIEDIFK